jgi:hypothetical protein
MQIVINLDARALRTARRGAALLIAGTLVWWTASVDAAVPNTVHGGTVISASQVNANFTDLDARLTAVKHPGHGRPGADRHDHRLLDLRPDAVRPGGLRAL